MNSTQIKNEEQNIAERKEFILRAVEEAKIPENAMMSQANQAAQTAGIGCFKIFLATNLVHLHFLKYEKESRVRKEERN